MSRPGGILALDVSTRTGWSYAHWQQNEPPVYGVWELGKTDNLGRLLSCMMSVLEDAIAVHQPSLVVFESPIVKNQTSARALLYLCGAVELACYENGPVECREAAAPTARKLVLGSGQFYKRDGEGAIMTDRKGKRLSENKSVAIAWCRAQGWSPQDDNAADSLVLLKYAQIMRRSRVMAGKGSI
jgi:Holliday junction resolvasome RuvABC endonuclease subunit